MAYLNNQLTKLAWFGSDEPAQPSATDLAFESVRKAITDEHKEKFNAAAESAADRSTLIGAGLGAGAGAGLSGAYAVGSSLKGGKLGSRLWNLVTNKGSNVSRTSRIANKLWKGRSFKGKAGLIAAPVLAMLGGGYLNRKLSQGQSDSMRESMFGPQVQAAAEEAVQKEASFSAATNMGYLTHQLEKLASAVEDSAKEKLDTLKSIGGGAAGAFTGAYGTAALSDMLENAKRQAVFNSKPFQRLAQKEVNLVNQLSPMHRYPDPELSARNLLKLSPDAMKKEIEVVAKLDKLGRIKRKMEAKGKLGAAANLGLAGLGLASSAGLGALGAHMATSD